MERPVRTRYHIISSKRYAAFFALYMCATGVGEREGVRVITGAGLFMFRRIIQVIFSDSKRKMNEGEISLFQSI